MATYELKKDHFLQDNKRGIEPRLHAKGATVQWEGPPSLAMKPLDQDAKDRKADYDAHRPKRAETTSKGWTKAIENSFLKDLTDQTPADAAPTSVEARRRPGRPRKAA